MASARSPSVAMLLAAAVLAALAAGVAALVPWLAAPQLQHPPERDADTLIVHLRDGRNVSYSVLRCKGLRPPLPECTHHRRVCALP